MSNKIEPKFIKISEIKPGKFGDGFNVKVKIIEFTNF